MSFDTRSSERVHREATATQAREPRTLPDAWYEEGCAERMADWIERFVPIDERATFRYGTYIGQAS